MQKIGPCKFSELPRSYRDALESGTPHAVAEHFFPYAPSPSAVFWAGFFSILYILPAVIVLCAGPYYVLQDSTLAPRILADMTSSLPRFLVGFAIFGTIAWGLAQMLNLGLRALARAVTSVRMARAAAEGKCHYGLLLDEQGLAFRHGDYFAEHSCAFLPKSAIESCGVGKVRVWFPKRSFDVDVVRIYYSDGRGHSRELLLRERFSMTVREMCDRIREWL